MKNFALPPMSENVMFHEGYCYLQNDKCMVK